MQPSPQQRSGLHLLRKNAARRTHKGVHAQRMGPIAHRLCPELRQPRLYLGLPLAKACVKALGWLGMGQVQAPLARQQKFAPHRRHGVKQMHLNARLGQHIGGHQARRSAAHNGHIHIQIKVFRSNGVGGNGHHVDCCSLCPGDRRKRWVSVKIEDTLAASLMFIRKKIHGQRSDQTHHRRHI